MSDIRRVQVVADDGGTGDAYEQQVQELLDDAVRDEMRAINAFHELGDSDDALAILADAVTDRINSAFALTWRPRWAATGKPHVWSQDGSTYARCTDCLAVSPPLASRRASVPWNEQHRRQHHPTGGSA